MSRTTFLGEPICFLHGLDLMMNSRAAQCLLFQSKNFHVSHLPLIFPAISKQVRARMIIYLCFKDDEIEPQRSGRSFHSISLHCQLE